MKNHFLLILLLFAGPAAKAQYPVLYGFWGVNGETPEAGVALSNNVLYSTTWEGGAYGYGCIFSVHTDGGHYKKILDFNDTNGGYSTTTLTLIGYKLYGMTGQGGKYKYGSIFSIDTNGVGYKDMYDFNSSTQPGNFMTLSNGHLFGMLGQYQYPAVYSGTIFSIDTNGTGYKTIHTFPAGGYGSQLGGLTQVGGKFYGISGSGGTMGYGSIFSIDANGNNYKDLYDYDSLNGRLAGINSLVVSGSKMYGVSTAGGTYNAGYVFSMDTAGGNYKNIYSITTADGDEYGPIGSLVLSGSTLYGQAVNAIFSIDTSGKGYNALLDLPSAFFTNTSIVLSGNTIYGTSVNAGSIGWGAVFNYKLPKDTVYKVTPIKCYGDSTGAASMVVSFGNPPYTYTWAPNNIVADTIKGLPAGMYTVTATDRNNYQLVDSIKIQPPPPISINNSTVLSACKVNNGVASVSVSGGIPPYIYSWIPGGGSGSMASGLAIGYYTCTITDSLGCTKYENFNIKDSGTLETSINTSNILCHGDSSGTAIANINGGTAPYTYSWTPYGGVNSMANKLAAGTYTVIVTDSNGCKADTFATITQPSLFFIIPHYVLDTQLSSCNGSILVNGHGGTPPYSYYWTGGSTIDSIGNLCPGIYCITATDSFGCIDSTCFNVKLDTTVGINQIIKPFNAIAYPNPSTGVFNFTINDVQYIMNSELSVYNTFGQKIYSKKIFNVHSAFSIDMSEQPSGVYFYKMVSNSGTELANGKLLINK